MPGKSYNHAEQIATIQLVRAEVKAPELHRGWDHYRFCLKINTGGVKKCLGGGQKVPRGGQTVHRGGGQKVPRGVESAQGQRLRTGWCCRRKISLVGHAQNRTNWHVVFYVAWLGLGLGGGGHAGAWLGLRWAPNRLPRYTQGTPKRPPRDPQETYRGHTTDAGAPKRLPRDPRETPRDPQRSVVWTYHGHTTDAGASKRLPRLQVFSWCAVAGQGLR